MPDFSRAEKYVDKRMKCNYRYVLSNQEYFCPHYHDYCEIFLILDGSVKHYVNNQSFKLKRGNLVFVRPNDVHNYVNENGLVFSMINITFTVDTLEEIFAFLGEGFPKNDIMNAATSPNVWLSDTEYNKFCNKMADIRAINSDDYEKIKTELRILIFNCFTDYFSKFEHSNYRMPGWLASLCEEMKKNGNFMQGASVMYELSDKSREHVSRTLKKYTGLTVSEFINDLRLQFIANMLENSNHSITDIVFESGFNNISHATKLFKQKYGKTMREYKNKSKDNFFKTLY